MKSINKKNKAFTLIELLGVVVIIGILVLIAFPPLLNQITKTKSEINSANKELIIDAAKDYVSDNNNRFKKKNGNTYCITIKELVDDNYLNPNLKDTDFESIDKNKTVKAYYNNKKFNYEIVEKKDCKAVDVDIVLEYPDVDDDNPGIICGEYTEEQYDIIQECHIRSIEDLVQLSTLVNSGKDFSGKRVILDYNLDFKNPLSYGDKMNVETNMETLTTNEGYTPIGSSSSIKFAGTFEGDNNNIKNLLISKSSRDYVALFGYNSGTIQGLNLKNYDVTGKDYTAALVGYNIGTIKGSHLETGEVSGAANVGSIAGYNEGAVTSSIVYGNVTGTGDNTGGIVGWSKNGNISSVIYGGNVTGNYYTGGLVGSSSSTVGQTTTVQGVFVSGTVTSTGYRDRTIGYSSSNGSTLYKTLANQAIPINGSNASSSASVISDKTGRDATAEQLTSINAYEYVVDTYIGGDNDSDGFYLDYDANNNFRFVNVDPSDITLQGSGTEQDPYLIYNTADMKKASQYPSSYIKLMNNLNYADKNFYALGSYQNHFTGTFEGDGHKISNIDIKGNDYIGFVGYNNGTVKNIDFDTINILGKENTGLVGYNKGTVKGIYLENGTINGETNVGSIAGYNEGAVTSSIAYGNVTGTGDDIGGIVGWSKNGNVSSIIYGGNVEGKYQIGGLVGYSTSTSGQTTTVQGVFVSGTVTSTGYRDRTIGHSSPNGSTLYKTLANQAIPINGSNASSSASVISDKTGRDATAEQLTSINAYEYVVDTYIGGDNDSDGFYLDYTTNNILKFVPANENDIVLQGSGTEQSPYLIYTIADMKKVSQYKNAHSRLMNDLNYTGENFYTLGSYQNVFTGTFDGNGHKISNIDIKGNDYIGFVGYNNGTVKNIDFDTINILGKKNTGLVGYNEGTAKGIYLENGTTIGEENVGSLVGYNQGAITSSIAYGNVTGTGDCTGGIVGWSKNGNVSSIIYGGNVTGNYYTGGLVGSSSSTSGQTTTVQGVFKYGSVTSQAYRYRNIGYSSSNGSTLYKTLANQAITTNGTTTNNTSLSSQDGRDATAEQLTSINAYEYVVDTYIGGDNDSDGFYLDYTTNNILKFVPVNNNDHTLQGAGTQASPYLIYTLADMKKVSQYQSAYIRLMSNLNYNGENFYTFGSYQNHFTGEFDGNGYTISNLSVTGNDYTGFIGYNNGTLKHINFNTINITGEDNVGVVGYNTNIVKGINIETEYATGNENIGGIIGKNIGTVSSVKSITTIASGLSNIRGNSNIGGIVGYNKDAAVISAIFKGNVTGTNVASGIAGYVESTSNHTATIKGVNLGGEVISVNYGAYRNIGSTRNNGTMDFATLSNKTVTKNGTITYDYSISSQDGRDASAEQLQSINAHEYIVDTYIGGENDADGFYLDYDSNDNLQFVPVNNNDHTLQGSGTEQSPYLIYTVADMKKASQYPSAYLKLMADLNYNGENFYTLGSYQNHFTGEFDGNGYTISNLTIKGNDYTGLIGYNSGTLKKINFNTLNILGERCTGLVGYNTNTIKGINIENEYVTGENSTGGIVGNNTTGATVSSVKTITTPASGTYNINGAQYTGGIVGYVTDSAVISSIFKGNVTGTYGTSGIAGYVASTNSHTATIKGVNLGGEVLSVGYGAYRNIGSTSTYGTMDFATLSNKTVTKNGTITNDYSISSQDGRDASAEQLQSINAHEYVVDTYIGGDNDTDGFHLDYDSNDELQFIEVNNNDHTLQGSGTEQSPYLIYTLADMKKVSQYPSAYIKLMDDLNYNGENFYTLGSYQNKFTGEFDGNNHTITNLSIAGNNYTGFIGYNEGILKDINFNTLSILGERCTGIVGYNKNTIKGINVENEYVTGENSTGGIVGNNTTDGIVTNVRTITTPTSGTYNIRGAQYVGGIVGYTTDSATTNAVFKGNVTGTYGTSGIAGYVASTNSHTATIKGVNLGGEVLSVGYGAYRNIGITSSYGTMSFETISDTTVTKNGVTTNSSSVSNRDGLDQTTSQLQTSGPYTTIGFNFSDTNPSTNEYIWYFDNNLPTFRKN